MKLTPPRGIVFFISLVFAVVGGLMYFGYITFFAQYAFILLIIGYVLLALACLFKNL